VLCFVLCFVLLLFLLFWFDVCVWGVLGVSLLLCASERQRAAFMRRTKHTGREESAKRRGAGRRTENKKNSSHLVRRAHRARRQRLQGGHRLRRLPQDVLEHGVVVQGRLGLAADARHHAHRLDGERARGRLAALLFVVVLVVVFCFVVYFWVVCFVGLFCLVIGLVVFGIVEGVERWFVFFEFVCFGRQRRRRESERARSARKRERRAAPSAAFFRPKKKVRPTRHRDAHTARTLPSPLLVSIQHKNNIKIIH
jgi:hypothetical protein